MDAKQRIEELKQVLKIDEKKARTKEIEKEMNSPEFWLDENPPAGGAQGKSRELKTLKEEIKKFDDVNEIAEIITESEEDYLKKEIDKLEIYALFKEKYDIKNAIVNFYAGAGGVDAQDWTEMLLKMYLRWAEANDATAIVLNESRGGEAGIKSATVEISGSYVFGKLKGENGVHRLVRQSPFNAKNLRQTSFALVEVMPEIETDTEINIDGKDLRVDTFHSSGSGGQSVNTTNSAIRITHLPTNIVVTCQNERSQLQNKETAMKILRSRLAQLMLEQHKEKVDEIRGDFSAPEWGNQIRSYVLHPYKLVKDHRTSFESKDPDKVLLGDLNGFIEAELKGK
ncbi:MAG: peptide chain release factor 2 [Patescibacteria group bacterium]|nr:peptide chain release factor 2 [Patescibacteria group bacterium]